MMKKLNFKDIVKMVHPDLNKDVSNSSVKMVEIIKHKDDPNKLYELAEKWGLIDKTFDVNYSIEEGKQIKINDVKGIIVDVIKLKKGIKIIVYLNSEFKSFYKNDIKDQDINFYVTGYAPENEYVDVDLRYQIYKKEK